MFYSPSSHQSGYRLHDGDYLNQEGGMPRLSSDDAIVLGMGTTRETGYQLRAAINVIVEVPVADASIRLPLSNPGTALVAFNQGLLDAGVHGQVEGDMIDAEDHAHLAAGARCAYYCVSPGKWLTVLMGLASG